MKNGKISSHQFKALVILFYIGSAVLLIPRNLAASAKQDAWIAAVSGTACALAVVIFYNIIGQQLGNLTLIGYSKKLLGRWAGGFVSFVFVLFLFLNAAALLWVLGNFITTQLIPETPIVVINTLFMLVVIFGSRLGLETIARSAEILFPWAVGGIILLAFFALPEIDIKNLQPIFEGGTRTLLRGTVLFQVFISFTLVTLLMIFPSSVNNAQEGKNAFFRGAITAGIVIIVLTAANILVHGAETTARNLYPSYTLAKKISIGDFLERLEAIIGMVWALTVFFKIILYFYGAALGFAQTLELKDYKPFALPLGMLVIIFSTIVYPDIAYAEEWEITTSIPYVLTIGLVLPLFLLVIGKLHRK